MKKLRKSLFTLSEDQVEKLRTSHPPERTYNSESGIIYRGHVPLACFLLLSGSMLLDSRRGSTPLREGTILGLKELVDSEPFAKDVRITPGSKVLILDRYTVLQELEKEDSEIHKIYKTIAS